MKKLFLLLVILPLAMSAQTQDARDDSRAWLAESRPAAEKSLGTLRALASANPATLGLKSADEAAGAQLDAPRIVYYIRLDHLRNYTSGASIQNLLIPQKVLYPVKIQGEVRSSVELEKRDAGWKAVTFGNGALAKRLAETAAPGGDTAWSIVSIPALNALFRATGSGDSLQLTALFDDAALGLRSGQTAPAREVLTALAIAARNHNGEPR